jgi:hypothetical protein
MHRGYFDVTEEEVNRVRSLHKYFGRPTLGSAFTGLDKGGLCATIWLRNQGFGLRDALTINRSVASK